MKPKGSQKLPPSMLESRRKDPTFANPGMAEKERSRQRGYPWPRRGNSVRQDIYTRVARILISVNPFCPLPIYRSEPEPRGG